jgi:hypothetical protein
MQDIPIPTTGAIDSEAKEPPTPVRVGETPVIPLAQTQEGGDLPRHNVDTLAPPRTASAAADADTRAASAAFSLEALQPKAMSAFMNAVVSALLANLEEHPALLAHFAEPPQPAKLRVEPNISTPKPVEAIVGMVQTRSASASAFQHAQVAQPEPQVVPTTPLEPIPGAEKVVADALSRILSIMPLPSYPALEPIPPPPVPISGTLCNIVSTNVWSYDKAEAFFFQSLHAPYMGQKEL